jgi:hypothetical protein
MSVNKSNFFFLITFLTMSSLYAQFSPEQVVQKNLDAYNQRDIEGFMVWFSPEIKMYNFDDGKLTMQGLEQVRKTYQELFELSPKLHSTILNRIVFDNKVIDHEHIVGRRGSDQPVELVLVYEVEQEKIVKIVVMRK